MFLPALVSVIKNLSSAVPGVKVLMWPSVQHRYWGKVPDPNYIKEVIALAKYHVVFWQPQSFRNTWEDFEAIQTEFASEEVGVLEKLCQSREELRPRKLCTGGLCNRQRQSLARSSWIAEYVAWQEHLKGMVYLGSPWVVLKGIHGGTHWSIEPTRTNWSFR